MITVVTKAFKVSGNQELPAGTVVDSTHWRNESRLINCRFLREATESEVADFKKNPPKARPAAKAKKAKAKRATPAAPKAVKTKKAAAKKARPAAPKPAPVDTEPVHSI